MKIRITWLATGAILDLQESDDIIGPQTTFLEIKGFIQMRYGFKPQQLLLVCDQVLAEDDECLKQYGIVSSETAEKKVIGCHVFTNEEAEHEQKELEQQKKFEAEQRERDAKREAEMKNKPPVEKEKKTEEQQAEEKSPQQQQQEGEKTTTTTATAAKKPPSSILSFSHDDFQKALKILGKDKFGLSAKRLAEVSHGNAPAHRPKFLDEAKSQKQEQLQSEIATGGMVNLADLVRVTPEWQGREADRVRSIFKLAQYGDRRKEADEFFRIEYPNYPDGPLELWDVREDLMSTIARDANLKPLIIELFYFCEVDKGVNLHKLGELVAMKLSARGLRVRVISVREAGCTYPLVAIAVTGDTPAEIQQLGEVFFEQFGEENATSTSDPHSSSAGASGGRGSHSEGGAPVPQEGCSIQ